MAIEHDALIIVAAGQGRRFGSDKQQARIHNIPVLVHTCRALSLGFKTTLVVTHSVEPTAQLLADYDCVATCVAGGETRAHSVWNGLYALPEADYPRVWIHDGARPVVSKALCERLDHGLDTADGCIPTLPLTDTIKRIIGPNHIETVDRTPLVRVQTPQVFHLSRLKQAFAHSPNWEAFTDDASLVEAMGGTISCVAGCPNNIKITVPEDCAYIEARGIMLY
jgi:2-C-methyl-D-erythritol 4-phosphate cytidylyltransferase/2-C-methyl-D-erythritol 2,4-cyclodiphosphate synthase